MNIFLYEEEEEQQQQQQHGIIKLNKTSLSGISFLKE